MAINSSLMTLGHCLKAMRERTVLPYREAKLTHIFKDALLGRGRLVMCVCVNPETAQYEETRRVLQVRPNVFGFQFLPSAIWRPVRPGQPGFERHIWFRNMLYTPMHTLRRLLCP